MAILRPRECIAGPISYYAVVLNSGKTVHLFGDRHDDMKGRCSGPHVIDIAAFLTRCERPRVFVEVPPGTGVFWREPSNMIRETMSVCRRQGIKCDGIDPRSVNPITGPLRELYNDINGVNAEVSRRFGFAHLVEPRIAYHRKLAEALKHRPTPDAITRDVWKACRQRFPDMQPRLRAWLRAERREIEDVASKTYVGYVETVLRDSEKVAATKRLERASRKIALFWLYAIATFMDASVLYNVLKCRSKDVVVVVGSEHANACASFFQTHYADHVASIEYKRDDGNCDPKRHFRCVCAKELLRAAA